ncbi:MAG: HEAT repeat domain-containing protein [Terriglobia bacterium]
MPALILVFLLAVGSFPVGAAGQKQQAAAAEEGPAPNYAWAPTLLYGIINSPNAAAQDALYDAAFAAGPAIAPDLVKALKDDRTAEFAAQALAFIGSEQAMSAIAKLVSDPRDLDLRRFFYGALGEFDTPQANQVLLNVIRNANNEPDRSVTEAAIIALTVRSDVNLLPPLRQAEATLTDPVIQDDLENTLSIIQTRAQELVAAKGNEGSVPDAVRAYFLPGLRPSPGAEEPASSRRRRAMPVRPSASTPAGEVHIEHVEFSPDKSRALAYVIFADPEAVAHYAIVLQKQYGDWNVASVWLGPEEARPRGIKLP